MADPLPPAGWYVPSDDDRQLRYWDGRTWTAHYAPRGAPPARRPLSAPVKALVVMLAIMCVAVLAWFSALLLLSDRSPDPEVQPLEVVVNSVKRPETPCLLNVDQIRAGDHEVSVIGESGYAKVRIADEHGKVAFRTDNEGQRIRTDEDGDITIIQGEGEGEGEGPAAHLEAGTYTVQCSPKDGKPGEATLEVLPARSGR